MPPADLDLLIDALMAAQHNLARAQYGRRDRDRESEFRAWRDAARDALRAAVLEAVEDGKRLDALEREAMVDPLVLHDGRRESLGGLRGLGLMPGRFLRRSLREAIDQSIRRPSPEGPGGA